MTKVISLGGSIVVPEEVDSDFISKFVSLIRKWLLEKEENKIVLIVGGGKTARTYINSRRNIGVSYTDDDLDNIGIATTLLNATLIKTCFMDLCHDLVITNPNAVNSISGKVLVGGGWKPGFSTDFDAVLVASKLGVSSVINLSNIKKLYNKDPNKFLDATPVDKMKFSEYIDMIGTKWTPGFSSPFDPIASQEAQRLNIEVILADGRNLENTENILYDREFVGSKIVPDARY